VVAETTTPSLAQREAGGQEETHAEESYVIPPVDIYEEDDGLVILADLPGVSRDSLEVRLDRGILTIQGRAQHLAAGEPIYRDYELTGFFRQFRLSDEVDEERVEAELKHGVLRIRLYRAERAQPKRIEVKASS
jgi:HSP20 family molecular chaperone IbpA